MRKTLVAAFLCGTAACIIASIALLVMKDDFIIHYGVRMYRHSQATTVALAVACAIGMVLYAFITSMLKKPEEDILREQRVKDLEIKNKDLDEAGRQMLYDSLAYFHKNKWKNMPGINKLLSQLNSMDEYQAELDPLLDQNGYLQKQPAEIIQQVEDCMYLNIKRLLNYMRIIQAKDPDVMSGKIADCVAKNADLLKKTDDFILSVTDYVNRDIAPGEEERTRESVNKYMYVVLEAIDLPETYLK